MDGGSVGTWLVLVWRVVMSCSGVLWTVMVYVVLVVRYRCAVLRWHHECRVSWGCMSVSVRWVGVGVRECEKEWL